MGAMEGFLKGTLVINIALDKISVKFHRSFSKMGAHCHTLDTFLGQRLGLGVRSVSSDAPQLEFLRRFGVAKDRLDDRATLFAGGPKDDKDFLCRHDMIVR